MGKDGVKLGFVLQRGLRSLFGRGGLGLERRELGFAVSKDGIKIWVCFVIGFCFAFSPAFPGLGIGGVFRGGRGLEGVDYAAGLVVAWEEEGAGKESATGVVVGTGCVVEFGDGAVGAGAVGRGGFDLRLCAVAIHVNPTRV